MNEADRELLLLLGSVAIRVNEIVTGLFEDSLSGDEQLALATNSPSLPKAFGSGYGGLPLFSMGRRHEPHRRFYPQHRTRPGGYSLIATVQTDSPFGGSAVIRWRTC